MALDPQLLLECTQNSLTSQSVAGTQILKEAKLEGPCFTIDMERTCYLYLDVHICGHANPFVHTGNGLLSPWPGPDLTSSP